MPPPPLADVRGVPERSAGCASPVERPIAAVQRRVARCASILPVRTGHLLRPYQIVMEERPDLTAADLGPDGILVRSEIGSVCGSDLSFYEGTDVAASYPFEPGCNLHESIGRVVASRSTRFAPGDRVLALPRNRTGLADLYTTQADLAIPVPEGVPAGTLVLAQPLGTVLWGTRHAESMRDRDVVIIGAGAIGLLWTCVARLHGARRIVVGDPIAHRLAVARELGATETWQTGEDDALDVVRSATDGRLADIVVEAVGHGQLGTTLDLAFRLVRRLGTIVSFGVPDEPRLTLDYGLFWRKNISLVPRNEPEVQRDFPAALQLILDGHVPAERFATHRFRIEDAPAAYDLASRRADGVLKVQITFD